MDKHTIRTLEYDKVLTLISRYASSDAGVACVVALEPLPDIEAARRRLKLVSEMKSLLEWGRTPPLAGVADTREAVSRAKTVGAMLDARVLLAISQTARTARLARKFFLDNAERAPLLGKAGSELVDLSGLEQAIDRAIDEDTNIRDGASPHLRKIRQDKLRITARIASTLQRILARENLRQHLQESLITIRSGRYVVPVRAESKSTLAGIVHDTSQSGATVFIEPMETVELNNTLRSLELEEKDEILRILAALTVAVREVADSLIADMEALFRLDVVLAAARFSLEFRCSEPAINSESRVVVRSARHPILIETQRQKGEGSVMPLDLELGKERRGLVITGPNAGGKTVALKTLGILTLLAKTGLHVPAGDGTDLALFEKIFVDIGDEQSIELSLSTFSSHMKNTIKVLAGADGTALVLLDEIGAGTDPAEGTALARAIIEELLARGATLVVTTHHMDLKALAHENPLLENASMEFDSRNMVPTYRLIQGVPGASHAFEIASRLGLEEEVLSRARAYCGSDRVQLEDLSRDLLEKIRKIEEDELGARLKRKQADEVVGEYERKLAEIKTQEKDLRKRALIEARGIVEEAKRTAERVVAELKQMKETKAEPRAAREAERQLREEAARVADAVAELEAPRERREPLKEPVPGARAYVGPLRLEGIIVSGPDEKGRVEVAVGALRAEVEAADLFEPAACAPAREAVVSFEAKQVPAELDVRGMTAEDAWETVDKYIDDAALCGLPFVRVIHGKGKGVLARRLKEMLATHPRVKSHRFGDLGEGGTGVTIIDLDKD